MATLTKIVTGMEKGPEAIQGNFDTLNGAIGQAVSVTDWTNAGITYLNGTTSTYPKLKYRTANFAGMHMVQFAGWINFPPFTAAGTVEVLAVPASILPSKTIMPNNLGSTGLSSSNKIVEVYVNSDNGHMTLVNVGQMTTGGSMEIDLTITF